RGTTPARRSGSSEIRARASACRRRQRIALLDRLADATAALRRGGGGPGLDRMDLVGQPVGLDGLTHPARVVAWAEVVEPGLVIHAVGDLREEDQVLGPEVQPLAATAEVEAALRGKRSLGVLAAMARAVGLSRRDLENERRLVRGDEPEERLAGRRHPARHARRRPMDGPGEVTDRAARILPQRG